MKNILNKIRKNSERGQAIILIAFSLVGMIAIVGLMIDGGILLIEYARLKRGIDAASIAAASQFRKDFVSADLERAGEEFLHLNQSDADVTIFTCNYTDTNWDATLCPAATGGIARKLVRITASRYVEFGFMKVVGFTGTTITATSVGEAASLDMVLVIDTSSSMSYDTNLVKAPVVATDNADPADPTDPTTYPGDDPEACNAHMGEPAKRCEPLGSIIDVAVNFVEKRFLFYPYDRVAIVATTEQTAGGNRNPVLVLPAGGSVNKPFSDNQNDTSPFAANTEIQGAIRSLKVFQPVRCGTIQAQSSLGGCLIFEPTYVGAGCDRPGTDIPTTGPTTCGSSNIGGGLRLAGQQFDFARQESFWVVTALIGGPATATDPSTETPPTYPNGFCPPSNWPDATTPGRGCRDLDTVSINAGFDPLTYNWKTDSTRHAITDPTHYDPDDYARDMADFVSSPTIGTGATIYSICLGALCQSKSADGTYTTEARKRADPWSGDHLGRYIAENSGGSDANHGVYYYSATAAQLNTFFSKIAENIFTRISQ
jgi:hypothetical protein